MSQSFFSSLLCSESVCVYCVRSSDVCQWVCVPPADLFGGCCLMSSGVFERLVEVKLLSAPGQRERTDERPLHHPNGIHKPLNQHCCHGFSWMKPETERERRRKSTEWLVGPHTPRTTLKTYTSARVRKMYNVNTTILLGGSAGEELWLWAALGLPEVQWAKAIRIWDRELMSCCPMEPRPCAPFLHWHRPRLRWQGPEICEITLANVNPLTLTLQLLAQNISGTILLFCIDVLRGWILLMLEIPFLLVPPIWEMSWQAHTFISTQDEL